MMGIRCQNCRFNYFGQHYRLKETDNPTYNSIKKYNLLIVQIEEVQFILLAKFRASRRWTKHYTLTPDPPGVSNNNSNISLINFELGFLDWIKFPIPERLLLLN